MTRRGRLAGIAAALLIAASPGLVGTASAASATPRAAALHAIAVAEDERRWTDGELARLLRNSDPVVRARAALAVGRLQDSTSVPALVPLLRDGTPAVREEAAFALGQIGHRSARPALEGAFSGGTPALRRLLVEALGKLGDRAATPRVTATLEDPDPAVRGEAAMALWRLADSTALEPLLRHDKDPDPGVRWRVLYALEKIHDPDRVLPAATLHTEDKEWLSRAYAVRTMGRQKDTEAMEEVLPLLDDAEPRVAVNAVRALQSIADTTSVACLTMLVKVLGHPDPYVRLTAAQVLGDRFAWVAPDSGLRLAAIDSLAAHLADPDAATRGAAARALAARVGSDAFSAVRPLLDDPSPYVRATALQALAQLPAARVLPVIAERARGGSSAVERTGAIDALGVLGGPDARAALREALGDSSALIAAEAASALGDLGDSASVPVMVRLFSGPGGASPDTRQSLREALARLGGAAFAESLDRAHPAPRPAATYGADFEQPSPVRAAVLHTSKGDIEWAFYGKDAVQTVKNFVRLARRGYFDGLAIHRVVPNFVIQDGDPTGTGSGGPGYTIRCEYNRLRYEEPGMVGMALSGKDTGGSQWFITHSPQPHLNGRYTIFAHVTRGMDVVSRIVQGDRVLKVDLLP